VYQSISEKYLKSEIVFVGKIKKVINNSNRKSLNHKWTYELVEAIKGTPLDTIRGSLVCGPGFREGDEVLIYGLNINGSNTISTNFCKGSRKINQEFFLDELELRALRIHKKYIGEKIDKTPIKYITKVDIIGLDPDSDRFYKIMNSKKKYKITYVLVKFSNNGEAKEIKFLSRNSRKIKDSISKIIKEDLWQHEVKKGETISQKEIIRCFLHSKNKLNFLDL